MVGFTIENIFLTSKIFSSLLNYDWIAINVFPGRVLLSRSHMKVLMVEHKVFACTDQAVKHSLTHEAFYFII